MNLAFAATMIRPRYLPDSIVAPKVSASAFLHSLDPKRTIIMANTDINNRAIPIKTMNANAFNFIVENLDSGIYVIKAEAEIDTCNNPTDPAGGDTGACVVTEGSESHSAAFVGLGSMVLDAVRLGNDVKNN